MGQSPGDHERKQYMPRAVRIYGESGYMHIYTRGNNKQIIFEDKADYIYYLNLLKNYCSEIGIRICCFCLMDNHVHLLIYDLEQNIPKLMKRLNAAYSGYFNWKYKRTGHLFEGRYNSIPIESEEYLLRAFRYILNNPKKANICIAKDYLWSSYSRYGKSESFVDTSVFQDLIGNWEDYESFVSADYEDCPELETFTRDDNWAKAVMRDVLRIKNGSDLQHYDANARNESLQVLKSRGLTIRQIERLTGISQNIINNA